MLINGFQDTGEDQKELNIFMRSFSRLKKVDPSPLSGQLLCLPEPLLLQTVSHEAGSAYHGGLQLF